MGTEEPGLSLPKHALLRDYPSCAGMRAPCSHRFTWAEAGGALQRPHLEPHAHDPQRQLPTPAAHLRLPC